MSKWWWHFGRIFWDVWQFLVERVCVEVVACEQVVVAEVVESVGTRGSSWSYACAWELPFVSKRWWQQLSNLPGRVAVHGRTRVRGSGRL